MILCAPAQAAEVIQKIGTTSNNVSTLQLFDPVWGLLESVQVDYSIYFGETRVRSGDPAQIGQVFTRTVVGQIIPFSGSSITLPTISFPITGTVGTGLFFDVFGSGSNSVNFTGESVQAFVGAGVTTLNGGACCAQTGPNRPISGFNATFTYSFTSASAVPEPTTWAMMLIGFGAVGSSMRRRVPQSRFSRRLPQGS
jgi:hypothetical protein